MNICQYGCKSEAKFVISSGKHCCSIHWNKCPGKRKEDSLKKKTQIPWNKGKKIKGYPHSDETKKHLSLKAKERNFGGYVKGSGRGKKGYYKGFFCDSSWELAFVIYCLDHNIPIKRNSDKFSYVFEGKTYNYIPDFIRTDKHYYFIEIKGFFVDKTYEKIKQFPYKLKIISGNGMKKYLDYVHKIYGKNFIELYEES